MPLSQCVAGLPSVSRYSLFSLYVTFKPIHIGANFSLVLLGGGGGAELSPFFFFPFTALFRFCFRAPWGGGSGGVGGGGGGGGGAKLSHFSVLPYLLAKHYYLSFLIETLDI